MATSFKKKSNRGRASYPAGTKVSLHNNQLLVSTGVPSFDSVIGGGLAVGTVLLLEEDNHGCHAKTLLKCFLAEGVVCGHSLFLATAGHNPEEIWQNLPCPVDEVDSISEPHNKEHSEGEMSMKIAWRYENMPKVQSAMTAGKFGRFFDFTKTIDVERMKKVTKYEFDSRNTWSEELADSSSLNRSRLKLPYRKLLNLIRKVIDQNGHSTSNQQPRDQTILRIAIHSLESPLWGGHGDPNSDDHSLTMFLYFLRGIVRFSYAVCFITLPSHIIQNPTIIRRAERLSDTVIRLESFAGSDKETNPLYKDYHGLFHIVRLPRINSLTCYMPESLELAFKQRRRKFLIEKLHLPPDVGETTNDREKNPLSRDVGTYSCGASLGGSKLDF